MIMLSSTQEWYDQRLNWSVSEFGGISSIRIPCQKLWLPDIVLYNSVDDYTSGYMPTLVMVYNNSRVFWGPVIRFRSSCKIDITFFPFDTQVCKLKMGSWAYTGLQVDVWNSSNTMDVSNFVDNGEWELLGVAVKRNVVYYACCVEPFPDVTFIMQLRRRTIYYFMNIIIPCIILSFLCLGGFLLPSQSGEKITLGLSVLLTITVFMLMVADKMPQTSESISVIGIYLMVVLATSCLSVLSSVLVLSLHHQHGRPSRAPLWLRKFCFNIVSPILRLQQRHRATEPGEIIINTSKGHNNVYRKESKFRNSSKVASSEDEREYFRMDRSAAGRQNCREDDASRVQSERAKHDKGCFYEPGGYMPQNGSQNAYAPGRQKPHLRQYKFYPSCRPARGGAAGNWDSGFNDKAVGGGSHSECGIEADSYEDDSCDEARPRGDNGSRQSQTYSVVVKYLINLIQTRHEGEVRDEEIFQEWHDVAFVLDRVLFYLFFLITLVSTVTILEMRPEEEKIV
ncbi:Neuronal acetylcholine receptor subunit alpha-10 [Bulinus truncatus]|nr:Neuronal acetylcholine receptor subunit alpha-10 [Bulinus truncatus]